MSLAEMIDYVTRGGATAVLLLIIWAFYTNRVVTRATHQRVLDERDEYKSEWSDALRLLGRATTVADKALKVEENGSSRVQAQRQVRAVSRLADDDAEQ